MGAVTTGYSGTPLPKKLGIKEGARLYFKNSPPTFVASLGELPGGARVLRAAKSPLDLVVLFARGRDELARDFCKLAKALAPAGMLWVAWPKKASGLPTDLDFSVVQRVGLDLGLVDTKICAIDEVWSGLKFVIRLKDRPKA